MDHSATVEIKKVDIETYLENLERKFEVISLIDSEESQNDKKLPESKTKDQSKKEKSPQSNEENDLNQLKL